MFLAATEFFCTLKTVNRGILAARLTIFINLINEYLQDGIPVLIYTSSEILLLTKKDIDQILFLNTSEIKKEILA